MDQNLLRRGARDYSGTLAIEEFTLESDQLAVRVKEAVGASGLEFPVIARHARVSKSWIYDIIAGDIKSPGVDKLDRLAKALGVTRDYLLTGKEHEEPTIENLAQLVAWDKQQAQQRLRHLEKVIEAEVERRLEERWTAYVRQQGGLTRQEVAAAEAHNHGRTHGLAEGRQYDGVHRRWTLMAERAARCPATGQLAGVHMGGCWQLCPATKRWRASE